MVMLCMMPMLGRLSATCRLYFEAPELAGIIICVSVRYSRDTCTRPQCVSAELALLRWPLGVVIPARTPARICSLHDVQQKAMVEGCKVILAENLALGEVCHRAGPPASWQAACRLAHLILIITHTQPRHRRLCSFTLSIMPIQVLCIFESLLRCLKGQNLQHMLFALTSVAIPAGAHVNGAWSVRKGLQ